MSTIRKVLGVAASAVGLAAAGGALRVAQRRRDIVARDGAGDRVPLGSLRSKPITVVADDGVPLHVEVDEVDEVEEVDEARADVGRAELTLVFAHGYSLNLDSWHFQRAAYRGLVRTVFYDQRSHGRSGRSPKGNATIEQLGRDLRQILDEVVPEGPVVLIGHSMGGMTVFALAEEFPDLFGDRVVGVGLVSTTAGGLEPHRILVPLLPSGLGGQVAARAVALLAKGPRAVDGLRRIGKAVAMVVTDDFAFGDDVPAEYVEFVDRMLSATPFEVVAEFFPALGGLDKFGVLEALAAVPTAIICGTDDKLTSIGHSRKLHAKIAGSTLLECEGAGHMVLIERHVEVDAELDRLLAAAADRVDSG